ncbi:hypothetical protein [Halobacillus sp. A5]|uniref:hypothetical protein n=1 Tax=Halobacillus sp. A5 TaxID=2880263 RepID=UPI0020A627B6|nr:hypothetical protein [Halobacillus sp. A5]MCP3026004.1 hypothetical protein [Halobacillus sp. A5]
MKEKLKNTWSKFKKTCYKIKAKTLKASNEIAEFVVDNIEDVLIFLGLLLIVIATLISFGVAPALYTAGTFMVLVGLGVIDPDRFSSGRR